MLYIYNMSTDNRKKDKNSNEDQIFKALADDTRRKILDLLMRGPQLTGDICCHFPHLDRCTVMLHLKTLERAELVLVRREGRMRWNHLNIDPIHGIYRRWIKKYAEPSVHFLTRLKEDLE